jgi:biopolymer transport protein ExbD
MRRFSERPQLQTLSELNVTPLLDLAFVLLIIFMITTPLMENSTDLVLPTGDSAASAVTPEGVKSISIHADQHLTLEDEEVSLAQLQARLSAMKAGQPDLSVVIRSHRDISVQRLAEVMDAAKRAGVTRLGFVSNPGSNP